MMKPTSRPRVAIFHELLTQFGGAERVAAHLANMFPDAPVFTLAHSPRGLGTMGRAAFPAERVRAAPLLAPLIRAGVSRRLLIGMMPTAAEQFDCSGFDVLISSTSAFAHGAVVPASVRHVAYVHSPARFLWDSYHSCRARLPAPLRPLFGAAAHRLRLWDCAAAHRPDILLANSPTVQERIHSFWHRDDSQVLCPPVDLPPNAKNPTPVPTNGHFLVISALADFKNVELAVRVFTKYFPEKTLLVVGTGRQEKALRKAAGANVRLLGAVSDAEKWALLDRCQALVHPVLEEDFGIAPVEALAVGRPVIASSRGGTAHTVRAGEDGLHFAPKNAEESLQTAITELPTFLRQFSPKTTAARARERFGAERFTADFLRLSGLSSAQSSS